MWGDNDTLPGNKDVQQRPEFRSDLMKAVMSRDTKELGYLLSWGADVNSPGRKMLLTTSLPLMPCYPLLWAVWRGNTQAVRMLLGARADPNICCHYESESHSGSLLPLCVAVRTGNADIVNMLLSAGAEVNAQEQINEISNTALLIAAHVKPYLMEALLARGADVNITDESGCGALHYVMMENNKRSTMLTELLIKAGANVNQRATSDGTKLLVGMLLRAGADPHPSDNQGRTALSWAVAQLKIWAIKWLIAENVDVETLVGNVGAQKPAFQFLLDGCHETIEKGYRDASRWLGDILEYLRAMQALALAGAKLVPDASVLNRTLTHFLLDWFLAKSEEVYSNTNWDWHDQKKEDEGLREIREIVQLLIDMLTKPLSLKHICKIQLRRSLGRHFHTILSQLHVPLPMYAYLMVYKSAASDNDFPKNHIA